MEIYEAPGFLDDCFRSTAWTLFQSAASQSFANTDDVTGDYATMSVTESDPVAGCGWRRDISSLALSTDDYPLIRVRLRGRGTAPFYKVDVEYTDASITSSGWQAAPTGFEPVQMELASGKTVNYVKLYAKCGAPSQTAYIDYDYAAVQVNPPLEPAELLELEADLVCNTAVSGLKLRMLNDLLLGVTERRYSFETGQGSKAYDLSRNRHRSLINAASWISGKYGGGLSFVSASSCRVETGYSPDLGAGDALSVSLWVKAAPGSIGALFGARRVIGGLPNPAMKLELNNSRGRVSVRDDANNVHAFNGYRIIADDTWHHVTVIFDPGSDTSMLYVDGVLDSSEAGPLGAVSLDPVDFYIGARNTSGVGDSYTNAQIDEVNFINRALTPREITGLATYPPLSGSARASPGNIIMLYLAAEPETLVYKLFTGRVIDRTTGGDAGEPWVQLVCEDLVEVMHERTFTGEYTAATQISGIVDDIIDDSVPELYQGKDTTNRTITNRFSNEGVWSALEKLADAASFASGENGANFYVDPGGAFRFLKYGRFTCSHSVTDGSDGAEANILDVQVKESIKGSPRLANDVKVIVFEGEAVPPGEDAWTESVESWSSPDPTDAGYPQSDTGDKQAGDASVHFNTTLPGSQYRLRYVFPDVDLASLDEVRFMYKYGAGLSPEYIDVKLQKGGWSFTLDYYEETGIAVGASASWVGVVIDLTALSETGNPGGTVNNLQVRFYRGSGDLGAGGFLIDRLRFIRSEKAGTASDSTSQTAYGLRTLRVVDKTITDTGYAGYVAGNLLEHRKNPMVTARAVVPGRGQPGYRPPMKVTFTSLKDGVDQESFQITRARHRYTPRDGYTCTLELAAGRSSTGVYQPAVAPRVDDLGISLAVQARILRESGLNSLRSRWI